MLIQITFDSNSDYFHDEWKVWSQAPKMHNVLWSYAEWLRQKRKWSDKEITLEEATEAFYGFIEEEGVDLD